MPPVVSSMGRAPDSNLAVAGSNPVPRADANRLNVPEKHDPSPNGDERFAGQPAAARASDETDVVPMMNWRVRCVKAFRRLPTAARA